MGGLRIKVGGRGRPTDSPIPPPRSLVVQSIDAYTSTTPTKAPPKNKPTLSQVSRSILNRTERSIVNTGMLGWRTAKFVAEIKVRDCTAPRTLPAEKRPWFWGGFVFVGVWCCVGVGLDVGFGKGGGDGVSFL